MFCSRCNIFWHTENPHRTGHNVESKNHPVCTTKEGISDSVNPISDQEISHIESSNTSDYSFTDNDIDLDSSKEIEEMCHVGTLAERFSLMKLKCFLCNPYISQSSVNRPNVYYRVEKLPPKGKQTELNRGDYSVFAQKTRDLIEDDSILTLCLMLVQSCVHFEA